MGRRARPETKGSRRRVGWGLIGVGAAMPELANVTVTPITTALAVALVLPTAAAGFGAPLLESRALRWFG